MNRPALTLSWARAHFSTTGRISTQSANDGVRRVARPQVCHFAKLVCIFVVAWPYCTQQHSCISSLRVENVPFMHPGRLPLPSTFTAMLLYTSDWHGNTRPETIKNASKRTNSVASFTSFSIDSLITKQTSKPCQRGVAQPTRWRRVKPPPRHSFQTN